MIEFEKITAKNLFEIVKLSKTLTKEERKNVADNSYSIAQGSLTDNSWMRAIKSDDSYIGFVMLHIGSNFDDGIDVDGAFLWRLMIAKPYQKKGYGTIVLQKLISILDEKGFKDLETSVEVGTSSPLNFYKKFGFIESGETFGDEIGLIFKWK